MGSKRPVPRVYLLWHPNCAWGEPLAHQLYEWLRPGNGLGPHVYFRSLPAVSGAGDPLPTPLPGERGAPLFSSPQPPAHDDVQVIVPLIDEHMVVDRAWRGWLEDLAHNTPPRVERVFFPVALHPTAFHVPSPLRELNFLRPVHHSLSAADLVAKEPPIALVRSLRKQLTEAFCRLMLGLIPRDKPDEERVAKQAAGTPAKLRIFLSHAKEDGTGPALRLRDYVYTQTQLAAFFDENDISFGGRFAEILKTALKEHETVALIAVRSARYAVRPWCRRELRMFRKPVHDPAASGRSEVWRLGPMLVVEALGAGLTSSGIPEFGNALCIRWEDGVPGNGPEAGGLEELIVTTLLREVALHAYHRLVASTLATKANRLVLNWLPDVTTLQMIPSVRKHQQLEVVYPGQGMSRMELELLNGLFPNLAFSSFEEAMS